MKFAIKHEIKGRIRIHLAQKHMTYRQADILQCYLEKEENISKASVYVRTQDVAVVYTGSRDGLIRLLSRFSYETAQVSESALENSGRELNETYKEKLINSLKEEAEAEAIVRESVGQIFARVLEDAGVYKRTAEGQAAFRRFVATL